jgi:hypothetical protein
VSPLLAALMARFTESGLAEQIGGGAHLDRAAPGTGLPYAVLTVIAGPASASYSQRPYVATLQWSVYGLGAAATANLLKALCAAFDDRLLSLSEGTNYHMDRADEPFVRQQPAEDPQLSPAAANVWGGYVTYIYGVCP